MTALALVHAIRWHWRREFSENVGMALDTLRAHKVRSGLTVFGVIVAVVIVIVVVALLMGFDRNFQLAIQSYGTNTAFFFHQNQGIRFSRPSKEERTRKRLDFNDLVAIQEACTSCVSATISVYLNEGVPRVRYKGEEIVGLDFRGVTDDFFSVYANAVVKRGRPFTAAEDLHRADVAVIGEDVAKGLFGEIEPLEKEVIANGHAFRVIGVLEKPKGGLGPGGDEDRRLVVPYWTFRKAYPQELDHGIRIEAYAGRLPEAIDQASVALRISRKVPLGSPDNFGYQTADSIIQNWHAVVGMIALVTAVLASVGLMIGGVGVMNIMLVSVTERTREIGVRKAIGARRRDIIWQFLTEATTLTGAGGVIGVLLGGLISVLIRTFSPSLQTFVPLWAVLLAVTVAASIGLFFGMYPAVKAARLDPVVALRYE